MLQPGANWYIPINTSSWNITIYTKFVPTSTAPPTQIPTATPVPTATPTPTSMPHTSTLSFYGNAGGGITNYVYGNPYKLYNVPNGTSYTLPTKAQLISWGFVFQDGWDIDYYYTGSGPRQPGQAWYIPINTSGWTIVIYTKQISTPTPTPTPTPPPQICELEFNDNVIKAGSYNLKYSRNWNYVQDIPNAYKNDIANTNVIGESFAVTFVGTQITWFGATNSSCGAAKVYIDDVLIDIVDCYSPTRVDMVELFKSDVLASGSHTLKVVLTHLRNPSSTGHYITVDKIDVVSIETPAFYTIALNDSIKGVANEQLKFSAEWRPGAIGGGVYGNDCTITNTPGSTLEVSFVGTGIKWYGAKGANIGIADVYIDDAFVERIDAYASNRIETLLFDSNTLPDGPHTLRIELLSIKNAASSDYYITVDKIEITKVY